jgi:hypothetical protein
MCDACTGVTQVVGLTEKPCADINQLLRAIDSGSGARSTGSTGAQSTFFIELSVTHGNSAGMPTLSFTMDFLLVRSNCFLGVVIIECGLFDFVCACFVTT